MSTGGASDPAGGDATVSPPISSIVYLSMHTCPLAVPGSGNAGGMNVYIDELSRTMAKRGIDVTVFTRFAGAVEDPVTEVMPGYRVVHVEAGPPHPIPMEELPQHVGAFTEGTLGWIDDHAVRPDIIHSHYWLSGWAGAILKQTLGVPLANSFHTLGRIKDLNRRPDEPESSPLRRFTETEVIGQSDCVIASTPHEFDDLLEHYGARPERLCTSPPGIDQRVFIPGDQAEARRLLGLPADVPVLLFVGRIQPLKGPDVAIETLALLESSPDAHLVMVGGPSGTQGDEETSRLGRRMKELGLTDRIHMIPPQPHHALPRFYQAADLLLVPSRSESFGLVAAEAQASGLPVVAAAVGGLPYVVADDQTGLLVDGHDPAMWAKTVDVLLADRDRLHRMRDEGPRFAARFSWPQTVNRLLQLYAGIRQQHQP